MAPGFWALAYIEVGKAKGIISGFPDQTFRPYKETTRAEAAVLIYRLLQQLEPGEPADLVETVVLGERAAVKAINSRELTPGGLSQYLTGFALARAEETLESIRENLSQQGGELILEIGQTSGSEEWRRGRLAQVKLRYDYRIFSNGGGIESSQQLVSNGVYSLLAGSNGWRVYYSQAEVASEK